MSKVNHGGSRTPRPRARIGSVTSTGPRRLEIQYSYLVFATLNWIRYTTSSGSHSPLTRCQYSLNSARL